MPNSQSKEWKGLKSHFKKIEKTSLKKLFTEDPNRFSKFSLTFEDILFDYSKNHLTEKTMDLLLDLARERQVSEAIAAMFDGKIINFTEKRAALHVALRCPENVKMITNNKNIVPAIHEVLEKMYAFTTKVRSGEWKGYSDKSITDVVNIGIGGSDLGPKMVCEALKPYNRIIRAHFVSNVDGSHLVDILKNLHPETTLFVISSKTFTTQETIANATAAKKWLLENNNDASIIAKHFVAVSTNIAKATEFGIGAENIFEFWEWVGGRFSLWSAIGLSIALAVGIDNFKELLAGAHAMDTHFRTTPLKKNIPVILGLIGVWYNNFWKADSRAVLAYDQHLEYFADFLQQLEMESNGKSVNENGKSVSYSTGSIVWGKVGTNGQHAFYQLLHQGTKLIPAEFYVAKEGQTSLQTQHDMLVANCFAQSEALMIGKSEKEVIDELKKMNLKKKKIKKIIPHKIFEGNRPSTTILYPKLTPYTLGILLALCEHRTYVQGILWNINSFDQWGVELGKELAKNILGELHKNHNPTSHDSSTNALITYYNQFDEKKSRPFLI